MSDCCALGSFLLASVTDPQIKPILGVKVVVCTQRSANQTCSQPPFCGCQRDHGQYITFKHPLLKWVKFVLIKHTSTGYMYFVEKYYMAQGKSQSFQVWSTPFAKGTAKIEPFVLQNRLTQHRMLSTVRQSHYIKVLVVEQRNLERPRSSYGTTEC